MSVGELCWICIGITINAFTFFIGFAVGVITQSKEAKPR